MCSSDMNYVVEHTEEYESGYGEWKYCKSGAIISMCRSGENGDCDGKYARFQCNLDIQVMKTSCSYHMGNYGENVYCPNGTVATGNCESGMNSDC